MSCLSAFCHCIYIVCFAGAHSFDYIQCNWATDWDETVGLEAMVEIISIISKASLKHCSLDPDSTWLVKCLLPQLADLISLMCNASLTEYVFPASLKQTIVRPRLKKAHSESWWSQLIPPTNFKSRFHFNGPGEFGSSQLYRKNSLSCMGCCYVVNQHTKPTTQPLDQIHSGHMCRVHS